MSIVNQVLNELEKRGVNTPLGEAALRPVVPRKQSRLLLYAFIAAVLLIMLVVAKWYLGRTVTPAQEKTVVTLSPTTMIAASGAIPVSAPAEAVVNASGVSVAVTPPDSLHGKPLLEVKSEEEPVVVPEVKKIMKGKAGGTPVSVAEEADISPAENPDLLKKVSPQQRAENEFLKANLAVQEGRTTDALVGYESALLADPTYKPARRAWAGLLVSLKRNDEAEPVLQRGLRRDPHDSAFAMMLARLQVERDAVPMALETLQKTLPYAEEQADYRSFMAALLQRLGRHEEAVGHYQVALKLAPNNGLWLMGMGISLQALQRNEEARDAYQRALATNSLNAQLQGFVQQKLKEF